MGYTYEDIELGSMVEFHHLGMFIVFRCSEVHEYYKILTYVLISGDVDKNTLGGKHEVYSSNCKDIGYMKIGLSRYIISNIVNIY